MLNLDFNLITCIRHFFDKMLFSNYETSKWFELFSWFGCFFHDPGIRKIVIVWKKMIHHCRPAQWYQRFIFQLYCNCKQTKSCMIILFKQDPTSCKALVSPSGDAFTVCEATLSKCFVTPLIIEVTR